MAVSIDLGHVWVLEFGCMASRVWPPAAIPSALTQANKGPGIAGLWERYETSYHNGNGTTPSKPVALIKASLLLLLLLCYPLVGKPKLRASGSTSFA